MSLVFPTTPHRIVTESWPNTKKHWRRHTTNQRMAQQENQDIQLIPEPTQTKYYSREMLASLLNGDNNTPLSSPNIQKLLPLNPVKTPLRKMSLLSPSRPSVERRRMTQRRQCSLSKEGCGCSVTEGWLSEADASTSLSKEGCGSVTESWPLFEADVSLESFVLVSVEGGGLDATLSPSLEFIEFSCDSIFGCDVLEFIDVSRESCFLRFGVIELMDVSRDTSVRTPADTRVVVASFFWWGGMRQLLLFISLLAEMTRRVSVLLKLIDLEKRMMN